MHFKFLSDHPEFIPQIARWYLDQWGHHHPDETLETSIDRLGPYIESHEAMPLMVLAIEDSKMIGVAQLKYYEMGDAYPDYEHWLGGVYVAEDKRGNGLGSMLVEEVLRLAQQYGVETLYLQTEALDGGLYGKLGWTAIAKYQGKRAPVLVMQREIPT